MDWELTLVLDPSVREAMYLRVARAIRDDIRRGRLPAGTSLPGTRRLAAVLGIHRDHVLDYAVAELIEEGQLRRHVQRVRAIYAERRAALAEALTGMLGAVVTFRPPERGTAIWATVRDDIDVQVWHDRARQRGVAFSTGRSFRFDDAPTAHARFGFAGLDAPQLREAVKRLCAALPDPPVRGRPVRATIREPGLLRTDVDA